VRDAARPEFGESPGELARPEFFPHRLGEAEAIVPLQHLRIFVGDRLEVAEDRGASEEAEALEVHGEDSLVRLLLHQGFEVAGQRAARGGCQIGDADRQEVDIAGLFRVTDETQQGQFLVVDVEPLPGGHDPAASHDEQQRYCPGGELGRPRFHARRQGLHQPGEQDGRGQGNEDRGDPPGEEQSQGGAVGQDLGQGEGQGEQGRDGQGDQQATRADPHQGQDEPADLEEGDGVPPEAGPAVVRDADIDQDLLGPGEQLRRGRPEQQPGVDHAGEHD
jgi:hypothetical protein